MAPETDVGSRGEAASRGPVVLFDGWCPLCAASVRFVLLRDARRVFRFAPLDSGAARQLLRTLPDGGMAVVASATEGGDADTVILLEGREAYTRSDAVLRIAAHLPWPWKVLSGGRVVPRRWRDAIYRVIAGRRFNVGGRLERCYLPPEEERYRFLMGPKTARFVPREEPPP